MEYLKRENITKEEIKILLKLKEVENPKFSTAKGRQKKLTNFGIRDIYNIIEEKEFICENAEEWWKYLWSTGWRSILEKISSDQLMELEEESKNNFNKHCLEDGLHQIIKVLFTFGRK